MLKKTMEHRLNHDRTVRTWSLPTKVGSHVFRRRRGLVTGLKHGFCTVARFRRASEDG